MLAPAYHIRGGQEEIDEVLLSDMLHLVLDSISEPVLVLTRAVADVAVAPPVTEPFPDQFLSRCTIWAGILEPLGLGQRHVTAASDIGRVHDGVPCLLTRDAGVDKLLDHD